MSLIVPVDATHDVKTSIRSILDELDSIKRKVSSLVDPDRVTKRDLDEIRKSIEMVYQKPTTLDFNDVFRPSGQAHALGYVPDPGTDAWEDRILSEVGWRYPLDGLIRRVTRLGLLGEQQLAGDIINILAHVAMTGNLSAANAKFKDVEIQGNLIGGYTTLKTWIFSGAAGANNQCSGTAETEIVQYGYTFAANDVKVGDLYLWNGSLAYANNANVKTSRVYFGTSSNTVLANSVLTQPTITHYRIQFVVRTATTVAISGFVINGANGASSTVLLVNAGLAVSDITTNSQYLKLTLQGGATADTFATDQQLILYRPRDTVSP